jgi:hypothetical protein
MSSVRTSADVSMWCTMPNLETEALQAIEKVAGGPVACAWFAMCDREAVTTVAHPVLGYVPCCARCAARAKGE